MDKSYLSQVGSQIFSNQASQNQKFARNHLYSNYQNKYKPQNPQIEINFPQQNRSCVVDPFGNQKERVILNSSMDTLVTMENDSQPKDIDVVSTIDVKHPQSHIFPVKLILYSPKKPKINPYIEQQIKQKQEQQQQQQNYHIWQQQQQQKQQQQQNDNFFQRNYYQNQQQNYIQQKIMDQNDQLQKLIQDQQRIIKNLVKKKNKHHLNQQYQNNKNNHSQLMKDAQIQKLQQRMKSRSQYI